MSDIRPYNNVVRGFSLVLHDPEGSHYKDSCCATPDCGRGRLLRVALQKFESPDEIGVQEARP